MSLDQDLSTGSVAASHSANIQQKNESKHTILDALKDFASSVPDFRRTDKGNVRHRLSDIIMLVLLGRISGHVGRADIIEFGEHNLHKFQKMGMLKNGVPSEATLCRVENGINSRAMADRMQEFIEQFHNELSNMLYECEIICVDGKAMRGTVHSNGRNPDIVSAYSFSTGLTLATEACQEKSNEIKAGPILIDKLDLSGKVVTADAMSMHKDFTDRILTNGGNFIIELKANQRSLRYGVEDKIRHCAPKFTYSEGPELGHGRIETRTYNVYDGLELIADKDKWGSSLTVVEFISHTAKKSTGAETTETRLYASSLPVDTPWIGKAVRRHWSIESMHWGLDYNFKQDRIKRKSSAAARNLDTIQRLAFSIFSIWKGRRKKRLDKSMGIAALMRSISMSFTKLIRFLSQK